MVPHLRHKMCAELRTQALVPLTNARHVSSDDAEGLAHLMCAAYRGTIDDNGETVDDARGEVQRTLNGDYGVFLPACSWLVEDDGVARSACLVTYFSEWQAPIIAFVMTDPAAKGQGLAAQLMKRSMNSLLEQGYTRLCLAVTDGNTAAQHLYQTLGFTVEESWTSGAS